MEIHKLGLSLEKNSKLIQGDVMGNPETSSG